MSTYLEQMAEFDRRRGKEPIDPTRIEGGPLPAATEPPLPASARELYGEPVEVPVAAERESAQAATPWLPEPRNAAPLAERVKEPMILVPGSLPELLVSGRSAAYRNRPVELSEREEAAVRAVVIRALARVVREQLEEVRTLLPRRRARRPPSGDAFVDADSGLHDRAAVVAAPVAPGRRRVRRKTALRS